MARKQKEQAVGSQNRTVTPNEAKSALTHCIQLQRPIMMWGAPGIGKSDIVKQIADSQKREVIDIRLPLWEPTDIKGIPYYKRHTTKIWKNATSRRKGEIVSRKSPLVSACCFDLGTRMKGNDGWMYIVKLRKDNTHFWSKKK